MAKLVIPKSSLPAVIPSNNGHYIRFRIITDDRNVSSYWSPIYSIPIPPFDPVSGIVSLENSATSGAITVIWDDAVDRPKYDVFSKFDSGDYFYHGSSPIHTYSFIKEIGSSSVQVAIQIESSVKERNESLTIYESSTVNYAPYNP